MQCIFAIWPWELLCGLAFKSPVGTFWAQQVPKWKSWGFDLAMVFLHLSLDLLFEVAPAILVEAASAQHRAKYKS